MNKNSKIYLAGSTGLVGSANHKRLKSLGYKKYVLIKNKKNLSIKLKNFFKANGPAFMEIMIGQGSVKNLMRPKNLLKIKNNFIKKN